MAVQFKFRQDAPPPRRQDVLRAVAEAGAGRVRCEPLFPGESDAELAAMYKVDGLTGGEQDDVLTLLERASEVEFAQTDPERRLIQ